MKLTPTLSTLACSALMLAPALAEDKTLIVTIENIAPQNGGLITPVWIGLHDGTFDIYDRDAPAPDFLEPLAEDGSTSAISEAFAAAVSDGVQATLASNVGIPPLAPGEVVSHAFNIDSNDQLYFSYASMIIPSNDAFIANGNPMAHPLFDDEDRFLGKSFVVAGSEVLDAGTEVNDEVPANTAALAQAAPNTGDTEGGNVVAHPGFMAEGNILAARPGADFLAENYHVLRVTLRCLEPEDDSEALALLDPEQEVNLVPVDSDGTGDAEFEFETEDDEIEYEISTRELTSDPVAAHLHLGRCGHNGPVIVNLTDRIRGGNSKGSIKGKIRVEDIVGPLAGDHAMGALIGELMSGHVYINIHTEKYPAGEVRGQVRPQFRESASDRGGDH